MTTRLAAVRGRMTVTSFRSSPPTTSRLFAPAVVRVVRVVRHVRELISAAVIRAAERVAALARPLRLLVSPETLALPPPVRVGD